MVTHTHKFKHDPTLANDIFQRLSDPAISSLLRDYLPRETRELLRQLKAYEHTDSANQAFQLTPLIKGFLSACSDKLAARNDLHFFFDELLHELQEINNNLLHYRVKISCALDCYILNHTTRLIELLQAFIDELIPRKNHARRKLHFISHTHGNIDPKKVRNEVDVANGLKCSCEHIRSEIGSADTKPKILIINFMISLCEAIKKCNDNFIDTPTLMSCIKQEINTIEQKYPELAEVGQELQAAYCKFSNRSSII